MSNAKPTHLLTTVEAISLPTEKQYFKLEAEPTSVDMLSVYFLAQPNTTGSYERLCFDVLAYCKGIGCEKEALNYLCNYHTREEVYAFFKGASAIHRAKCAVKQLPTSTQSIAA